MHRILEYTREALEALWRNRARSILTILGMIIGTSAVIGVFGVSRAATAGFTATIASFGTPSIFLFPDPSQTFPQLAAIQYRDVGDIRTVTAGTVAYIMPSYSATYNVRAGNVKGAESVQSTGSYAPSDTIAMQAGRKFTDEDIANAARVCTLTPDLAQKYFPHGPAVGNFLTINGSRFRVVGVYGTLSGSLFNTFAGSGQVFIPFSTFHSIKQGPVDSILFYATDPADPTVAMDAVKAELRHLHGPKAKYISQDGAAALSTFMNVLNIIAAGLSAIGAVALLVAGIGVMNIMLVSVAERTREIGIRKSLGASRRDITLQFLMESIILCLAGGGTGFVIGLVATIGAAAYISKTLGAAIVPYVLLVCLALAFSIGIGMAFGLYPAIRASRLDPIEALRS